MKTYQRASVNNFNVFNPNKFYAGRIKGDVVSLEKISFSSNRYFWKCCNDNEGGENNVNNYNGWGEGFNEEEIFSVFDASESKFYEFDTQKRKYSWIVDNL